MNSELLGVYVKLEKERQQILDHVSQLSADHYHRSVNGKWSISQILTHLLTSERLALVYMRKKSLGIKDLKNSGWLEQLKLRLLQLSQRLPLRYKAPKEIVLHTPAALPYDDLQRQWDTARQELKVFLEQIEKHNIRKKIFKHPIAGRLNAFQGVAFLREHQLHHLPQIKRLL